MLIGIDASRATKVYKTGTEYYSKEIILALSEIDRKNRYLLYSPSLLGDVFPNLPKNFSTKVMPFPRLWSQLRLSVEMLISPPDVLFLPAHTIPLIHPKKIVVTIHDLGFKYFPSLYTSFERRYHNFCLDFSVSHATKIITPSHATKKDLISFYKIDPSKIVVIYHGYNQRLYYPLKSKEQSKLDSQISHRTQDLLLMRSFKPYLFFIGRIEEKKNILGLIEAYLFLRKEKGIGHKLILAGKPGYGYDKIKKKIEGLTLQLQKDIIQLGYIPEQVASEWMRHADIFVFPSFFEGFGLPCLEAMASGIPVVASNVTSLPEVIGKSGILVNPKKPFEIAAAISKIIHQPSLRKALISKGLVRSSLFSWRRSAEETLNVIESV